MDFILNILSYWDQALAVILVLGLLIFFHELGHFLAARAMGIGVVTFSMGMGPRIWGKKIGKTDYRLSLFPFGGYVASVGEYSPDVEKLGFTAKEAVYNRPPWQRILLAFSGPFFNIFLAFVIYWGITFSTGLAIPLAQIGIVLPDSAAEAAGLQPGDTLLQIDNVTIDHWGQVPGIIGAGEGKTVTLLVEREGVTQETTLTPKQQTRTNIFGEEEKAWLLGIQNSGAVRYEPQGFFASAAEGWRQTWFIMDLTVSGIWKLLTGSVSADNLGGPILIAQMVGSQAEMGIIPLLLLTALISVNLGLLNLLPVPILDGGLILFCLIEMVTRRPVSEKVQERAMQVGALLLIALMLFATWNDIMRILS